MENVTLLVAVIGSVLALVLPPAGALAAYITTLVVYPVFLTLSAGTLDVSAGRIVALVLFLRCLCSTRIMKSFRWCRLDTWITVSMVVYIAVYALTRPFGAALENRGGFVMDTWLAYLISRMLVTNRTTLANFIRCVSVVMVGLAVMGMIEALTQWNPYRPLVALRTWNIPTDFELQRVLFRYGLVRACGPFSHAIMFGASFALYLPLVWALRRQRGGWGNLTYVIVAVLALGTISSMSSSSWMMLIMVIFCLAMEKCRQWVKPLLIVMVVGTVLGSVVATRPFYRVVAARLNFAGGNWWQRADLIDAAIRDFWRWCWLGYGGRDPGWGARVGMRVTDLNNEFIAAGVNYGLLGIIVLCIILVLAFRGVIQSYRETTDKGLKSLYWSFGSILVSTIVTWMGVSFFSPMPSLFYSTLGIMTSSLAFAHEGRVLQVQRRPSEAVTPGLDVDLAR